MCMCMCMHVHVHVRHLHGICTAPRHTYAQAATRNNALAEGCVRANATELIWWDPKAVNAAMVTCGGLCPGLNSIIKGEGLSTSVK